MNICKTCIKWLYETNSNNGTYGYCQKNKYWCNENYECIKEKAVKDEN